MKRFITIYNGVSQICRKKYLLMHQMQMKQESQLLKMEKEKFLKGDWPAVLKKADQLNIDLVELVNKG